jgi:XTP/dITP diphosphohydrolase
VCSVVAVLPDKQEIATTGILKGEIGEEEKGVNGFGYDPIFFIPQRGCYISELTNEEKNMISHRASAIREMINKLKNINVLQ